MINHKESTAMLVVFMKTSPRCLTARKGHLDVYQEEALQNMSPQ